MKKLFVIWCLVMAAAITMGICACASAEVYPQTFVVGEVDYDEDIIVLVDYNEHEWIWEGTEDYMVGDIVAAIMEDNGTPIIYDDDIITIRYAGYMEGWD